MSIINSQFALPLEEISPEGIYTFCLVLDVEDESLPGFRYEVAAQLVTGQPAIKTATSIRVDDLMSIVPKYIPEGTQLQEIDTSLPAPLSEPLHLDHIEAYAFLNEYLPNDAAVGNGELAVGDGELAIGGISEYEAPIEDTCVVFALAYFTFFDQLQPIPESLPPLIKKSFVGGQGGSSGGSGANGEWVAFVPSENDLVPAIRRIASIYYTIGYTEVYTAHLWAWAGQDLGASHILRSWEYLVPLGDNGVRLWASGVSGIYSTTPDPKYPIIEDEVGGVREWLDASPVFDLATDNPVHAGVSAVLYPLRGTGAAGVGGSLPPWIICGGLTGIGVAIAAAAAARWREHQKEEEY
jgi:hypothetical protein